MPQSSLWVAIARILSRIIPREDKGVRALLVFALCAAVMVGLFYFGDRVSPPASSTLRFLGGLMFLPCIFALMRLLEALDK
jgi:hypothetical protein